MICRLCPRECGAQRTEQRGSGFCGMPAGIRVARAALHRWEEPPISGTNGSGAVFFSGCTLRCCYCQNHAISAEGFGKDVTPRRLRAIFEELIAQGAHNIDLITATHFLPWILLSRLPALYQDLVYVLPAYAQAYGLNWSLDLPPIPLSPLAQTAVFDLFHLAVALLFLPAYTAAQASYFDTALETNPIPQPPQLPQD